MRRLSILVLGLLLGAAVAGCDNQGELPARVRVVHVAWSVARRPPTSPPSPA